MTTTVSGRPACLKIIRAALCLRAASGTTGRTGARCLAPSQLPHGREHHAGSPGRPRVSRSRERAATSAVSTAASSAIATSLAHGRQTLERWDTRRAAVAIGSASLAPTTSKGARGGKLCAANMSRHARHASPLSSSCHSLINSSITGPSNSPIDRGPVGATSSAGGGSWRMFNSLRRSLSVAFDTW